MTPGRVPQCSPGSLLSQRDNMPAPPPSAVDVWLRAPDRYPHGSPTTSGGGLFEQLFRLCTHRGDVFGLSCLGIWKLDLSGLGTWKLEVLSLETH